MNINKSAEILRDGLISDVNGYNPQGYSEYAQGIAVGYLEAHEKAKRLVEVLKESILNCGCCEFKENPCANCLRQGGAIAKWEEKG